MRRRDADEAPNFWPSYTDVSLLTIFLLIIFVFSQLISTIEGKRLIEIQGNQQKVQDRIQKSVDAQEIRSIDIENRFAIQKVTFSDKILFEKGRAELLPQGVNILGKVADVLRDNQELYYAIQVEGHTDKDPVHEGRSQFRSNWDLSSARATAVVKFFADKGLDPSRVRMSANGFAEFQPVDAHDSAEAMRRNRRIELVIDYAKEKEGGGPQ